MIGWKRTLGLCLFGAICGVLHHWVERRFPKYGEYALAAGILLFGLLAASFWRARELKDGGER